MPCLKVSIPGVDELVSESSVTARDCAKMPMIAAPGDVRTRNRNSSGIPSIPVGERIPDPALLSAVRKRCLCKSVFKTYGNSATQCLHEGSRMSAVWTHCHSPVPWPVCSVQCCWCCAGIL